MEAALGLFGLGQPCAIHLELDGDDADRKRVSLGGAAVEKGLIDSSLPLYGPTESLSGRVSVTVKDGKALQHLGIHIEFIGCIEMLYDRENSQEFISLVRDLEDPASLTGAMQYPFVFSDVEKAYDTYNGINVRLRYFLRVTIFRAQYTPNLIKDFDIAVQHTRHEPPSNTPIRMEVGIEDALHIEFEYNKSKFHLTDVIIGKIYFLLVRIKIKRMEIEIRKRESAGVYNETDTLAKFEVMDGAPVRGESIPVRLFLSGFPNLTPTYRSVNNKFSVKYYLNLVLVDEDDRRYFKQAEISLWRASQELFRPLGQDPEMKVVHGDLLGLALLGHFDVIVHGCNCFNTFGAGIAKSIRQTFPEANTADSTTPRGAAGKLGTFSVAEHEVQATPQGTTLAGHVVTIVNAYTQFQWQGPPPLVNYEAVRRCFAGVKSRFSGQRIAYPMLGAGLAGGDWAVIESIIDSELGEEDHTLVIYK